MKSIVYKNYDELSKAAADIIAQDIKTKPNLILGLATGSTPLGLYKELISRYQKGEINFSDVITFNLDEYYKIDKSNNQSYYYFMHQNLFNHINVKNENINIPDGSVDDPEKQGKEYDKMIEEKGGIDLQVLGIGQNGHIGFNEPDKELVAGTHLTKLTDNTIEANSRFFDNIDDVPKHAITMGMGSILKAKKIILLANGKNKARIIKEVIKGNITTQVPASLLKLHRDVTVLLDEEAACEL